MKSHNFPFEIFYRPMSCFAAWHIPILIPEGSQVFYSHLEGPVVKLLSLDRTLVYTERFQAANNEMRKCGAKTMDTLALTPSVL